jgi:hypothetical protein
VATTLDLIPRALNNVDDVAGRWQFEGGDVYRMVAGQRYTLGRYACIRRVLTNVTDAQNTAMLTITVFFFHARPPENLTLMRWRYARD